MNIKTSQIRTNENIVLPNPRFSPRVNGDFPARLPRPRRALKPRGNRKRSLTLMAPGVPSLVLIDS